MVRSGSVFCARQKTLTNKQQSLGVDFLRRDCCICYVRSVHFIKLREGRRQRDIFAHRQSSIWEGDENKFLERDTDNLFNLVLLRLRRPLVSSCRSERLTTAAAS